MIPYTWGVKVLISQGATLFLLRSFNSSGPDRASPAEAFCGTRVRGGLLTNSGLQSRDLLLSIGVSATFNKRQDSAGQVQSVNRAIMMLELLAERGDAGVTTLATQLGINKAATFRILSTLRAMGYVERDKHSETYRLTLRIFDLGSKVLGRIDPITEARPLMHHLAEQTHETVHLAILDGHSVVYVDKIDAQYALRLFSRIGKHAPAWCTGVGKALLSDLEDSEIEALFEDVELIQFTENTITSIDELKLEVESVRRNGFAVDNEEHESGIRCVAASLRDRQRRIVAAISISWPTNREHEGIVERYRDLVVEAAEQASQRIGSQTK